MNIFVRLNVLPCGDVVELAQSDYLDVLHHDGADVALDSVAENDVTMLLQLLQNQLTLARRDAMCVYVCMNVQYCNAKLIIYAS